MKIIIALLIVFCTSTYGATVYPLFDTGSRVFFEEPNILLFEPEGGGNKYQEVRWFISSIIGYESDQATVALSSSDPVNWVVVCTIGGAPCPKDDDDVAIAEADAPRIVEISIPFADASDTIKFSIEILYVSEDVTFQLGNSSFAVTGGDIKLNFIFEIPNVNDVETVQLNMETEWKVPDKGNPTEIIDSGIGTDAIKKLDKDPVEIVKNEEGSITGVTVKAVFNLDLAFPSVYQYTSDTEAYEFVIIEDTETSTTGAKFNTHTMKVLFPVLGTGNPETYNFVLDPSIKVEKGDFTGGFSLLGLIILLVVLISLIILGCIAFCVVLTHKKKKNKK